MPITTGLASRTTAKGEGHIHTDKWHRCIEHVKANSPGYEPHAVCTNAIGYKESVNPEHRTPGPHASANTRRFKEAAKKRREDQKMDYARVLKEHKCWGHACGTGGGASSETLTPGQKAAATRKQRDAEWKARNEKERAGQDKTDADFHEFRRKRLGAILKELPQLHEKIQNEKSVGGKRMLQKQLGELMREKKAINTGSIPKKLQQAWGVRIAG